MLLPFQGESLLCISITQGAASLCPGLGAGCPFRAWTSAFPHFRCKNRNVGITAEELRRISSYCYIRLVKGKRVTQNGNKVKKKKGCELTPPIFNILLTFGNYPGGSCEGIWGEKCTAPCQPSMCTS